MGVGVGVGVGNIIIILQFKCHSNLTFLIGMEVSQKFRPLFQNQQQFHLKRKKVLSF